MDPANIQDVVALRHLGGHRLWLRFDDGVEGELDFKRVLKFRGIVAALRDPQYFAKAFVHPEARVVTWPNGVDVDTLVLYSRVTGCSIRSLFAEDPIAAPALRSPARRRAKARGRSGSKRRPKATRSGTARPRSHR